MKTSEQLDKIAPALTSLQAELEAVAKDAVNPHLRNKYASLDAIWAEIRPKLAANGLAVIQGPTSDPERHGGTVGMETRIIHNSGQWVEMMITIPLGDIGKGRSLAQEVGSTITYLRRYCIAAALGLVTDEDDDAGPAEKRAKSQPGVSSAKPAAPKSGNGTTSQDIRPRIPEDIGKEAYWNSLGEIERACYRSWPNVLGHLYKEDHFDDNEFRVKGAIKKLFPGFEANGYPTASTERDGRIRVSVYRTVKAYGELRDAGQSGDQAAVTAFETVKNAAPA